jgi:hypothetical protein
LSTSSSDRMKKLNHGQTISKSRRAVSFAPPSENEIYEVLHIDDYSSELIDSTWYNKTDYRLIQTSCAKIICKMNDDTTMKNTYWSRGLENFTDDGALFRRTIRDRAMDAVMEEQTRQWENDVFEPVGIADIYAHHCIDCKFDAINTARRDECEKEIEDASTILNNSTKDIHKVHHAPLTLNCNETQMQHKHHRHKSVRD